MLSTWWTASVDFDYLSNLSPKSKNALSPLANLSTPLKFVQYGSTCGWANQMVSLEHALWLAHATNRVLILPPLLKHKAALQWTYVGNTIDQVYKSQVPHVPMTRVLDLQRSWQHSVTVMDWIDFQHYRTAHELTENNAKQLYEEIRCNKMCLVQDASLHGITVRNKTCTDWVGIDTKEYEYRLADMHTEFARLESDILTFNFIFPSTLFGHPDGMEPRFQLVYQPPIRDLARQLMPPNKEPYVAIHVRGGDMPYSRSDWPLLFNDTLARVEETILKQPDIKTLLVISDICDNMQAPTALVGRQWQVFYTRLKENIKAKNSVDIKLRFSSEFASAVTQAGTKLGIFDLDVMVDQQMAACAHTFIAPSKGVPGRGSTFAARIKAMREQRVNICDE